MKKILILIGMFVLTFGLVSCGGGGGGGGNSYMYEVILDILGNPTCPVGEGREFLSAIVTGSILPLYSIFFILLKYFNNTSAPLCALSIATFVNLSKF